MSSSSQHCDCQANGLRRFLLRVAASLTTALLIQSASLIWWASAINERVKFLEKGYDGLSSQVYRLETSHGPRL